MTFKILSGSVERAFAARPGTLVVIAHRIGSRVVHLPAGRSRSSDPTQ
jgi:hypothetical protein